MSLKEIYNLSYDLSGFNSGLINWYNKLIDKQYAMLSIEDVARMIRQDILKEVAIKKAIDLFFDDPYNGEYEDGELLKLLASLELNKVDESVIEKLKHQLKTLQTSYVEFDWEEEELRKEYKKNIDLMLHKIDKT
jgi:hypothetical protein